MLTGRYFADAGTRGLLQGTYMSDHLPDKKPLTPSVHHLDNAQRRALAMLAGCQPRGCTEAALMTYGVTFSTLADLVRNRLVTTHRDTVRARDRTVRTVRLRITGAGLRALQAEAVRTL
jgi:hypothetical protein